MKEHRPKCEELNSLNSCDGCEYYLSEKCFKIWSRRSNEWAQKSWNNRQK